MVYWANLSQLQAASWLFQSFLHSSPVCPKHTDTQTTLCVTSVAIGCIWVTWPSSLIVFIIVIIIDPHTHTDDLGFCIILSTRPTTVMTVMFSLAFVCLSVLFSQKLLITKLDIEVFPQKSWKPVYFAVKRLKVKFARHKIWVFALLWLLASSGSEPVQRLLRDVNLMTWNLARCLLCHILHWTDDACCVESLERVTENVVDKDNARDLRPLEDVSSDGQLDVFHVACSITHSPPQSVNKGLRMSSEILLPQYLMNGLNNFDKTDGEYSLALADDLIRFWRSKVKVTAWFKYVVVKTSTSTLGIKVHLLVFQGPDLQNIFRQT